jgi:hypothetical protein
MGNPTLTFERFQGSPEKGSFSCRLVPHAESLRWLVSERGMGNALGTVPFGGKAESHTFLGVMSPAGGILLSTPPPLPERAVFTVEGDRLSVSSPVPVSIESSAQGLLPLLREYGRRHRRPNPPEPVFGWNSWDNFSTAVTEADVLANLDFIASRPALRSKLTHVIVDDGWQTGWGHWTPNGKFPGGMDALAGAIHAKGLKAGLWLAPLMVQPDTPLYRRESACLLKDLKGHPYLVEEGIVRSFYALDVSVPRSQDFLRDTFRRVREWGYDYVKLDFLYNQARCLENGEAVAADPSWSSNRHIVEMLRIAREELGPDVHILGCNYPFELGGAGVDEARLTNDIATFWQNVDFCYRAHAARFFMARNWFATDPDFAIVRVPGATWSDGDVPFHVERAWRRNEADAGWRKGPYWNEEEMKLALALVILGGGSVILGDHLPQLNADGLRYVETALRWAGGAPAWPLDLDGVRPLPCVFRNDRLLAFLNPFSTPLTLPIPPDVALGPEIFTNEAPSQTQVIVAPHSCKVYQLRAAEGRP